jgi:hypothetical protein
MFRLPSDIFFLFQLIWIRVLDTQNKCTKVALKTMSVNSLFTLPLFFVGFHLFY